MIYIIFIFHIWMISAQIKNYPTDGMINTGNIYEFQGQIPTPRVHNTISASSEYIIVYGGYNTDSSLIDGLFKFY